MWRGVIHRTQVRQWLVAGRWLFLTGTADYTTNKAYHHGISWIWFKWLSTLITLTLYWQLTYPLQGPGFTSGFFWGGFWEGGGLWCLFCSSFQFPVLFLLAFLVSNVACVSALCILNCHLGFIECLFTMTNDLFFCTHMIHGVEYSVLWNITSIKKGMLVW